MKQFLSCSETLRSCALCLRALLHQGAPQLGSGGLSLCLTAAFALPAVLSGCVPVATAQSLMRGPVIVADSAAVSSVSAMTLIANAQAGMAEQPASLTGTLFDVNGGLVPGATVTVLDKDGKSVAVAESDSQAEFAVTGLVPGVYRIKIVAPGLETFESPAIQLKAGEQYRLPQTALPIATANETVNVVLSQEMIADMEMKEELKQRVLGVFPAFYTSYQWNAAPLNTKQKFRLSLRSVIDPVSFATTAVVAGIEQANNTFPGYGTGLEGYGKRYGAAYGDAVVGRFIGYAVLPSIFRQDPRYFYMGPEQPTGKRVLHAIAFSVTARSDHGHTGHLVPNYSHILGNFIAGYISKTYHPDENSGLGLATENALVGIGGSAVQALLREFLFGKITAHLPQRPLGKQASMQPAATPAPVAAMPATVDRSTSTPTP